MSQKKYEMEWGGHKLTIETGELAKQAGGSCLVTYGETVVLATATINKDPREGTDFFPLMVEYEERTYAAGRIKGSRFIKREAKPTDEAILTARLIDRGLRPLFDERLRNDVQVIVTVLQYDEENDPDIVAILAASCAIHISEIPWAGPIAPIRIGQINGELVINPSYEARTKSEFDLTLCYNQDKIINIEAGANESSEDAIFTAMEFGVKHTKKVIDLLNEVRSKDGKEKIIIDFDKPSEEEPLDDNQRASQADLEKLIEETKAYAAANIGNYLFGMPVGSKKARKEKIYGLKNEIVNMLQEKNVGKDRIKKALEFFDVFIEEQVTKFILNEEKRVDGRALNQIRELSCRVGLLSRVHGSALFNRGETQVLSITTLGGPGDAQELDGMELRGKKRFMHHYNFPPYSTGEVKALRGTGRREIGHGALAEKAILPVLPKEEDFPYTIRVVSEVLGSNGSSSMGSTCGTSLSLMDAGVPIKKHVAGVAMGLASDKSGNYKILTDLQDLEDGEGGMDFKVTGTRDGITAIQMDTKTAGLTLSIAKETLARAKEGRYKILDIMESVMPAPRANMSPYAPRIVSFMISPDKIRDVIGSGGKVINEIIAQTGVQIDIEDSGLVMVVSNNETGMTKAVDWIKSLTKEAQIGEIYIGKVISIREFGAFVEIYQGKEGMVHISEITDRERVNDINKYLKVGQSVKVKVIKIDDQGKVGLSIKQAS